MTTPSEGWLVLKAQAGDTESLDRLLRAVHGPLLGFVMRMLRDPAAAEDVMQDTMLIIARKLRWLERPDAFRPWVYRIAARTALKALKREQRRFALIDRDTDVETVPAPAGPPADDVLDRLPAMLASVSPASRVVLVLHFLEGLPLQAVSDILEIPLGTVKSRLAYGLRVLRGRVHA